MQLTTAPATQPEAPAPHQTAHWRLSYRYGGWGIFRESPRISGFTYYGDVNTIGSAALVIQGEGALGDTVEIDAPGDPRDHMTGTVCDYTGGLLLHWRGEVEA